MLNHILFLFLSMLVSIGSMYHFSMDALGGAVLGFLLGNANMFCLVVLIWLFFGKTFFLRKMLISTFAFSKLFFFYYGTYFALAKLKLAEFPFLFGVFSSLTAYILLALLAPKIRIEARIN